MEYGIPTEDELQRSIRAIHDNGFGIVKSKDATIDGWDIDADCCEDEVIETVMEWASNTE